MLQNIILEINAVLSNFYSSKNPKINVSVALPSLFIVFIGLFYKVEWSNIHDIISVRLYWWLDI